MTKAQKLWLVLGVIGAVATSASFQFREKTLLNMMETVAMFLSIVGGSFLVLRSNKKSGEITTSLAIGIVLLILGSCWMSNMYTPEWVWNMFKPAKTQATTSKTFKK